MARKSGYIRILGSITLMVGSFAGFVIGETIFGPVYPKSPETSVVKPAVSEAMTPPRIPAPEEAVTPPAVSRAPALSQQALMAPGGVNVRTTTKADVASMVSMVLRDPKTGQVTIHYLTQDEVNALNDGSATPSTLK